MAPAPTAVPVQEWTVPVLPGAEPFAARGSGPLGGVGVLLCHGFTGNPGAVRAWGEHLAAAGCTVVGPRLPGHGTTWQEAARTRWEDWYAEVERALAGLVQECDVVVAAGLSMGGTLVLRLAQEHAGEMDGVVTVNASLATERRDARLLPLLARVLPRFPGVAGDVKAPGVVEEGAYRWMPLRAALSLQQAWPVVLGDLGRVRCPVLAFRSREDHVVEPVSGRLLLEGLPPGQVREVVLEDSYHVATIDHDAPLVFARTLEFVREVAGVPAPSAAAARPP